MPVLSLFTLQFSQLFEEVVSLTNHFIFLLLSFTLLIFQIVLEVFDSLVLLLYLVTGFTLRVLGVSESLFVFRKLASHLLSEVDVTDSLFHHEIDGADSLLDVCRLGAE